MTRAARPTLESALEYTGARFRQTTGNQKVLCPAHDDRRPSCSVNLGKGVWMCQSCGAKGTAWDWLMATEGCDFRGAVDLAERLGLPTEEGSERDEGPRSRRSRPAGERYTPSWRK